MPAVESVMLTRSLFIFLMLAMPQQSVPRLSRGKAPSLPGRSTAPIVLEGGRPGSRALLIALHGGTFSNLAPLRLAERCRDKLSAAARAEGLRLLVPVAPDSTAAVTSSGAYQVPWSTAEGERQVFALIDEEVEAHRADATRIYLAGQGAGATGALVLAARHPVRIAAVAAWAGTPPPLWDGGQHVVGLLDDPVSALADMPVYLWTARDDVWLDREALGLLKRGLSAQRTAPRMLIEDETGGHGYGMAGPGPGLRFLHGHRRKPQPLHPAADEH